MDKIERYGAKVLRKRQRNLLLKNSQMNRLLGNGALATMILLLIWNIREKLLKKLLSPETEWQKSQMLKDAYVESQIVEDGRIELEGEPLPCLNPIILLPYPQFKPGDRVHIIVLKDESK